MRRRLDNVQKDLLDIVDEIKSRVISTKGREAELPAALQAIAELREKLNNYLEGVANQPDYERQKADYDKASESGESKMKITKEQLAKIIKEEYNAAVSEAEKTSH